MADIFSDELRRLVDGVNKPQSMYEGWENPYNKSSDKSGEGVYSTPFNRQGGDDVAQRQLDLQSEDILKRMRNGEISYKEALDRMDEILKGENISPADKGETGPAPTDEVSQQFNYRGAHSSEEAREKYHQTEKDKEDERKGMEREKEKEDKDREKKEMAAAVHSTITATVASVVDQRLAPILQELRNLTGNTQSAAQQSAAQPHAQQPGAWRENPGIQQPFNSREAINNGQAAYSMMPQHGNNAFTVDSPHQAEADKFMSAASDVRGGIRDPHQLKMFNQQSAQVYATLLSGVTPNIDDPMLRNVADKAGVRYSTAGLFSPQIYSGQHR